MLYSIMKSILVPFSMFLVKEIKGLENIPEKGAFILASNHCSYLDPVIIPAIFVKYFKRKVHYLGKKELLNSWLGKKFHAAVGTIPLDREKGGKTALKLALDALRKGKIIGIFPEGTRSANGKLQKGKTGVARLALAAKVPVIPIYLEGTFNLMPRGAIFPKLKKGVTANIGKPIYFNKCYGKQNKAAFRKAAAVVMKKIAELSKQKHII